MSESEREEGIVDPPLEHMSIVVITDERGPCVRCGATARMRRVYTEGTAKPFIGVICIPCAEALQATEGELYVDESAELYYTNDHTGQLTPASIGVREE